MPDHKITESGEMYLIAIHQLRSEDLSQPLPITDLAGKLAVQPVSANQMVNKLSDEGWVDYLPYQGVRLTKKGLEHALRVLRQRRLWEVFFVRELGLDLEEAQGLACDLEHLVSESTADRLAGFLDHPKPDPHDAPRPAPSGGDVEPASLIPLSELTPGMRAAVASIPVDPMTQKYLSSEGIQPGKIVKMIAMGSSGDCLIEAGGKRAHLSAEVASAIWVKKGGIH